MVLKGGGTIQQAGEVLQHEEPLLKHAVQFLGGLVELGHLQVDERQLVVEHLARGGVRQLYLVAVLARTSAVEAEVEDADDVHALQLVVPVAAAGLFADGKCGVIQAAVLEELLLAALHLHQELFAELVLAVHVEHGAAVGLARAQVLGVQVRQFLDLLPEQLLEAEVGVGVDVAVFDVSGNHGHIYL